MPAAGLLIAAVCFPALRCRLAVAAVCWLAAMITSYRGYSVAVSQGVSARLVSPCHGKVLRIKDVAVLLLLELQLEGIT